MIVETSCGKIQGHRDGAVTAFKGVPYAAPPVGPLRFRPPEPPPPWRGVREALAYGPAAPQPYDAVLERMFGRPPFFTDEAECLTLNVWTPGTGGPGRPVLAWLHGGAFVTGSGSDPVFDGTRLAERGDVVLVTVNYRLGALGYLHLGDLLGEGYWASGNSGLLDQMAALGWVRDNIAAFGGDPADVTVFGQSAGAASVAALLGAPAAAGLVHKAIMQSGSGEMVTEPDRASAVAHDLLAALDLDENEAELLLDLPVTALVRAQQEIGSAGLPFAPVVDHVVMTQSPLDAIRAGAAREVSLVLGTNRDEGLMFSVLAPGGPSDDEAALIGEWLFWAPTVRLAEARAATSRDTWMYEFAWPSTAHGGRLGACHSMELPFVFDNLAVPGVERFTGAAPPQRLATEMASAWVSFARTGRPDAEWPAYDAVRRRTRVFDVTEGGVRPVRTPG